MLKVILGMYLKLFVSTNSSKVGFFDTLKTKLPTQDLSATSLNDCNHAGLRSGKTYKNKAIQSHQTLNSHKRVHLLREIFEELLKLSTFYLDGNRIGGFVW